MKKRIVSLLLALCMVFSAVPSFGAAATTGTDYVYDLARLQWGQWSTQGYNPDYLTDWDVIYSYDVYWGRDTDPFMYFDKSSGMTWTWTATSNNGVGPTIIGSADDWGGMKIRVGESAQYDISIKTLDNAAASNLKFYLAPVDAIHPRADQYYLGETAYTETTPTLKELSFGTQYLEAGDYTLVFQITTAGESLTSVGQVMLNWVSYDEPEAQPKDYAFDLARLQWGQWSSEGVDPSTLTTWGALYDLGNYYNRTSDPFKSYPQSSDDINVLQWRWTGTSNNGVGPVIGGAVGEWGGITIRVGQSALYNVSLKMRDDVSASTLNFYLAPADAEDAKVDAYYIGTTAFTGSGALNNFSFGEHYLAAGDYALVFEIVTKGSAYTSIAQVDLSWLSFDETVGLATQEGASVRIREPQGQRFKSSISKAFLEGADVVEYGTILMPTEDLQGDIDGNLIVGYSSGSHTAALVPAEITHSEDAENVYFTAVLIQIPAKYYGRSITARAYAKLSNGSYVYGDTYSSRSILEVAENGKASGTASAAELAVFEQIIADAENA